MVQICKTSNIEMTFSESTHWCVSNLQNFENRNDMFYPLGLWVPRCAMGTQAGDGKSWFTGLSRHLGYGYPGWRLQKSDHREWVPMGTQAGDGKSRITGNGYPWVPKLAMAKVGSQGMGTHGYPGWRWQKSDHSEWVPMGTQAGDGKSRITGIGM